MRELGFGIGVTHWHAGRNRAADFVRRSQGCADRGGLSQVHYGGMPADGRAEMRRGGIAGFATQRGRSGRDPGAPGPGSIERRITAFQLFSTYGLARATLLAFPYTGLWCTCRTVPVASSGHSASPGADGRIAFVAGGHDCGEAAACRNFRSGRVRMEDPDRRGNAGEAVDVVGERTGPRSPVKLSGAIPPLAESFHQRPETGLDLRAGL